MKPTKWCRWLGHKWVPVYIGITGKKFIGAYCSRCMYGHRELHDYVEGKNTTFATYSEKYFKEVTP